MNTLVLRAGFLLRTGWRPAMLSVQSSLVQTIYSSTEKIPIQGQPLFVFSVRYVADPIVAATGAVCWVCVLEGKGSWMGGADWGP